MSRISRMLIGAAIGAFAAHAACADTTEQRLAFGAGPSASCGAWTKARQSKTAQPAEQWVAGYLSGVNTTSDEPDTLMGTDWDGVMTWMDNYCEARPLDKIVLAAIKLVQHLRANAKGQQ
jgi:hypothetical protein